MSAQSARDWLLKIAQEVEDDPTRWTRNNLAISRDGEFVSPDSAKAVCWCALGFTQRDKAPDRSLYLLQQAAKGSATVYNDSLQTAADFVAWFRKAAELCT